MFLTSIKTGGEESQETSKSLSTSFKLLYIFKGQNSRERFVILPFSKRTQSIIVVLRKGETPKIIIDSIILIFFAKTVSFKISDAQSETL